jgi:hypothetical protein
MNLCLQLVNRSSIQKWDFQIHQSAALIAEPKKRLKVVVVAVVDEVVRVEEPVVVDEVVFVVMKTGQSSVLSVQNAKKCLMHHLNQSQVDPSIVENALKQRGN